MISGKAIPSNCKQFIAQYSLQICPLGSTNLMISQVGFGGYRIDVSQSTHREALRHALSNGINLIDTSSNYADGRSETLIGQILTEMLDNGTLSREAIVIISKAGYLQGENYALAERRKKEKRPFPNLVKLREGLDHCIHPDFLEDQLTRSLNRLNLETIDGYLLHNPEYYLQWAKTANIPLHEARIEYYRRIKLAFHYLEKEVKQGRIQWYGISSNTFPASAQNAQFTSLEKVWQIAEAISPTHHFRIIQLPMNLMETGAATEPNLSDGQSTLSFAHAHDLAVLINRPLNGIQNEALIRLADVLPPSYPTTPQEVSTAVDTSLKKEMEFRRKWLPKLDVDKETRQQLLEYLAIGTMLNGRWAGFGSSQNWHDLQSQFLLPRAQSVVQFLSNQPNLAQEMIDWLNGYVESINDTLSAVGAYYQEIGHKEMERIRQTAVFSDPDWEADTLSQTAVRALRSTEGISCVLVGMRQTRYVDDILADLKHPIEIKNRDVSWKAMQS